ncbi:gamma-glutamylcyclotransferase family protein [Actinoplanes sp. NPDC048988]|uniref:gamma-glutamylcyclotransferase family protein n=1 Tax=Actinoplanes sp. NPDC048988 TaxID=3363901 RepID=UPI0037230577
MPLLFSYGTLRDPAVQRSTFGRELNGRGARVTGFRLESVEITDPHVLKVSGETHHPILVATGDPADGVDGAVFEVTEAELQRSDDYEVDDYQRVAAPLATGESAWVYVAV